MEYCYILRKLGFPEGSDGKESAWTVGDLGSIQDQEDPLEKGMATHASHKELDTTEWLTLTFH